MFGGLNRGRGLLTPRKQYSDSGLKCLGWVWRCIWPRDPVFSVLAPNNAKRGVIGRVGRCIDGSGLVVCPI